MNLQARIILLAAVLSAVALGQGLTGSISGTITDQSGSAVPAAQVTLVNTATSQTRELQTQPDGDFVFTQLLPGTFRLTVSATGFKKFEQNDIVLTATERVVLGKLTLAVGEMTQTVLHRARLHRGRHFVEEALVRERILDPVGRTQRPGEER